MPPPEGEHGNPPASASGRSGGQPREIIFEFTPIGGSVKVTATDVQTGVEVVVVGPAGPASQRELERIAIQKLKQRLERESETPPAPPRGDQGGGIIV